MFKMLIAVDGSPPSDRAIEAVAAMAKTAKAEIEVVLANVREEPQLLGDLPAFNIDELIKHLQQRQVEMLAKAAARAKELGLKVASKECGAGLPAAEVVAIATRCRVNQIVMGSHGRGSVGSLLLGSVALRVLQLGEVPVLLVK